MSFPGSRGAFTDTLSDSEIILFILPFSSDFVSGLSHICNRDMTMRFSGIIVILVVGIFCQGCVVFHYPTPEVRGSVVDAVTQKPIAGVRVQDWKHRHISCETSADGTFDLPAGRYWGPCFLMLGDYLIVAHLTFSASGYQTATNSYLGGHDGKPAVLNHPIELKR